MADPRSGLWSHDSDQIPTNRLESRRHAPKHRRAGSAPAAVRWLLWALLLLVAPSLTSCQGEAESLEPRWRTFAELRTIRRPVSVQLPHHDARAPYPRERLVDGQRVSIAAGGLVWLRRDAGAALLVSGPAALVLRADRVVLERGRAFVDTPPGNVTTIETPGGLLALAHVRASIEVDESGRTDAYVLSGELRDARGTRARAGERWVVEAGQPATVAPVVAWQDWTGGLGTSQPAAALPPFGVGSVAARPPSDTGQARTPLAIQSMDVRVTVVGDFAVTEVDQRFFNPAGEKVEGIYTFRTPQGAVLQRFGVDRAERLVWGRVKERQAAAAQYASNVYEGSDEDPALLQWDAPDTYRARLYPIGPGESRRVVVRYSEWLGRTGARGERRLYVFPMAAEGSEESLPVIEDLTVKINLMKAYANEVRIGMGGVQRGKTVIVRAQELTPRADLAVELFDGGIDEQRAYRADYRPDLEVLPPEERANAKKLAKREAPYLLVPVRARDVPLKKGGLDLVIVLDRSAATHPSELALARSATRALLAHLGHDDRVVVLAGAERLEPVVPDHDQLAPLDAAGRRRVLDQIATLPRGGATDLGAMLSEAATKLDPKRRGAVVYVGDARATVGELSAPALEQRLAKLPRPVRVFGLGIGPAANLAVLEALAKGAFAERVVDTQSAARAALRLFELAERPAWLGAEVDLGPSVANLEPRHLGALMADETQLVVGRLASDEAPSSLVLRGPEGERRVPLEVRPLADEGDLRRRWAEARLRDLIEQNAGPAALVDLGSRYGIVTPFTSFYVPTTRELAAEGTLELEASKESIAQVDEQTEADEKQGGTGTRAKGEEGSMGKATNKRYAVAGPKDNPDPSIARQAALHDAQEFGSVGLLNSAAAGDPNAPTAPWGRDTSLGGDNEISARGNQWGDDSAPKLARQNIDAPKIDGIAEGAGGMGLSGVGEGGGGMGGGTIGLGTMGGTGQGFGSGHGRLGGTQASRAPHVRMGATSISGSLPPEVVQRIVRQNYGRFRLCYERGLASNPNLEGRVAARFLIGPDGEVVSVENGGSDLPDSSVVSCVLQAYRGLSFPAPEGGSVRVHYPIHFQPGEARPASHAASPAPAATTTIRIASLPHAAVECGGGARVPLADRMVLWRERLRAEYGEPSKVASVYRSILEACEAPAFYERRLLANLLLEALPQIEQQVALWRLLFDELDIQSVLYRGIRLRARSADERRRLHEALGLRTLSEVELARALAPLGTAEARIAKLRALVAEWPNDLELALTLLHALEDAGDGAAARRLAGELRARDDADARVRGLVGELYLRLSENAKHPERDRALARQAFGEIVEFAPEDPVARRRLGDIYRAHAWFDDARRQYETLQALVPDDDSVPLLIAATAHGQGRLEEAVRWTEKGNGAAVPDIAQGPAATARALAATYLAWGRQDARRAKHGKELAQLTARAEHVLGTSGATRGATRVVLTWSHPELFPSLWTDALGAAMPAPEGDPLLGIAQAHVATGKQVQVEVRLDESDVELAARLGAEAVLTVVFDELSANEKVVRVPLSYSRGGPAVLKLRLLDKEVIRG